MPAPVTSYSSQVFAVTAPLSSSAAVVRAGRVLQVIPVSVQPVPVRYTAGPLALALLAGFASSTRASAAGANVREADAGREIVQVCVAGVGSVLPAGSVARTDTVCVVAARPL